MLSLVIIVEPVRIYASISSVLFSHESFNGIHLVRQSTVPLCIDGSLLDGLIDNSTCTYLLHSPYVCTTVQYRINDLILFVQGRQIIVVYRCTIQHIVLGLKKEQRTHKRRLFVSFLITNGIFMPLPLYYLLLVKVIETSIDTIRIMVT